MIKTESVTLSNSDKLSTLRDLGTMLSAGIPLLESVQALLEDSRGNQKKFLEVLRDDLTQGKHVYFTFSKFPNVIGRPARPFTWSRARSKFSSVFMITAGKIFLSLSITAT